MGVKQSGSKDSKWTVGETERSQQLKWGSH